MSWFSLTRWGAPELLSSFALVVSLACGSPPPQVAPSAAPRPKSQQPASLNAVLGSLDAEHDVLAVLPRELSGRLSQALVRLSPAQRGALLSDKSGLPQARPLLHLSAGGDSPSADWSILSAPSVAGELRELLEVKSQGLASGGRIASLLAKMNRRAAVSFLRRLSRRGVAKFKPSERYQIAIAARAIGGQFEERVLELMLTQETTAELALLQAGALARLRRPKQARARLKRAVVGVSGDLGGLPPEGNVIQRQVAAAALLESSKSEPGVEAALARARALLQLGDAAGASAQLGAMEPQPKHLGYALALHEAHLGAVGCSNVPRHLRTPYVCRAVHAEQVKGSDWDRLSAAWSSGEGRDATAVETYLAFAYVLPMTYGLDSRGARGSSESYMRQVSGLTAAANQAAQTAPHFSGMAAFADVLHHAFRASIERETPRGAPGRKTRSRLLAIEAEQAAESQAGLKQPWSQAARLAVAALLVQDADPQPILQGLASALLPQFYLVHGALATWNALSRKEARELSPAEKKRIQGVLAPSSERHLEWELTQAEARAYREPSTQATEGLKLVAQRALLSPQPLSIRLRAALSAAGIAARAGELDKGWQLLERLLPEAKAAAQTRDERELLISVQGYRQVLGVLRTEGAAGSGQQLQAASREAFRNFVEQAKQESIAPPAVQAWLLLWLSEFDYRRAQAQCAGAAGCQRSAESRRGIQRRDLEPVMGEAALDMFASGRLALGGLSLELSWSQDSKKLSPKVQLTPRFPYVHFPKLVLR